MKLHNKWGAKIIAKGIKKLRLNNYLIKKITITEYNKEITIATRDICNELEQYSKKPKGTAICNRANWNDEQQNKLSIIVPVYNTEKYIATCVESLLKQNTRYQYQIIIINDGTPDQSIKRIEHLLEDQRVRCIEQSNRGLSGARNTGLECIHSEYVAFVDADDYVSDDFVQKMMQVAMESDADIVQGGFLKFILEKCRIKSQRYKEETIKNKYIISGFAWGKVYRSALFKQIQFPADYWYEDSIMPHLIYPQATKIITVSDVIYFYRTNWQGISKKSVTREKCIDSTWILVEMLVNRRKIGLENDGEYFSFFLDQLMINYRREFNVEDKIKKDIFFYNCTLLEEYFAKDVTDGNLSVRNMKLCLSLKNRDYSAYNKIGYLS